MAQENCRFYGRINKANYVSLIITLRRETKNDGIVPVASKFRGFFGKHVPEDAKNREALQKRKSTARHEREREERDRGGGGE